MPTRHVIANLQYVIRDGFNAVGTDYRGDEVAIKFERDRKETKSEAIERLSKSVPHGFADAFYFVQAFDKRLDVSSIGWPNAVERLLDYLKSLPDDNDSR